MTLISEIGDSLAVCNFADREHSPYKVFAGDVLGVYGVDDYIAEIEYWIPNSDPVCKAWATWLCKMAKMRGYNSASLDDAVKSVLDGIAVFEGKHLPIIRYVGKNWFDVYRFGFDILYREAKRLNYLTSKWNSTLAWQELKAVCINAGNKGVLYADPTDNSYNLGANRFYDENAETMDCFLELYEVDKDNNKGALEYARDVLWVYVNNTHWAGDHYNYRPDWVDYECEGAFFHLIFCRIMALNGYGLANWDRVLTDCKSRYLNQLWASPQWSYQTTPYYCVVHHHSDNEQRRLENTIGAWFMLQNFYQILDADAQSKIKALLDSAGPAWQFLLTSSGLYDSATKKFRWYSGYAVDTQATSAGCLLLFLLGIVPQTGSIYAPIYEFRYECWFSFDKYWLFDYTNRKIRIPVRAGDIKFLYGDTPVTQNFATDGVYEIVFEADWNSIASVTKIGDLDPSLTYARQIGAPPVQKATTLDLTLIRV